MTDIHNTPKRVSDEDPRDDCGRKPTKRFLDEERKIKRAIANGTAFRRNPEDTGTHWRST